MTIREVAQKTGLSHQAIYKRLKSRGVKLEEIKDKATGQLTPDGEALIADLFAVSAAAKETAASPEVDELTTRVAELSTEVEKLRTQVEALEKERDFLREALTREQQLHGIALSKLPTALPPTEAERTRLRVWWDKLRGRA